MPLASSSAIRALSVCDFRLQRFDLCADETANRLKQERYFVSCHRFRASNCLHRDSSCAHRSIVSRCMARNISTKSLL
jgi:hypothetical protein